MKAVKRGRGRPRLDDSVGKVQFLHIRVTKAEVAEFWEAAIFDGMKLSPWCRKALMDAAKAQLESMGTVTP